MPKPNRQKVHYVLTEDLLPEVMGDHIGEFYVARAEGTIWYVSGSGAVVSLIDLLRDAKPVAPPRHGKDGAFVIGPRGIEGKDGHDGRDGRDGKDGIGYAGPQGPPGRPGKDCECKTAIAEQHIVRLTQKLAESSDTLAAVRAEFADLKMQIAAVRSMMTKSKEYIEFLTAKNAAKLAARKK
jgi:hypothetical protein